MRTFLLFISSIILSGLAYGQASFSDDFEGYAVGDYIGVESSEWTTWSGTTGTAEDATVTTDDAASGSNAILIAGVGPDGGPQDVVLPFGGRYTEGGFSFSMNMRVADARGAYFNFQGQEAIGQEWVFQAYFEANGELRIDNGDRGFLFIVNTYPRGEWFKFGVDVNLTDNVWKVSINDECIGSFTNFETDGSSDNKNAVASLDLFPRSDQDVFYVDDVTYKYTLTSDDPAPLLDAGIGGFIDRDAGIGRTQGTFYGINGTTQNLNLVVGNTATTDISSLTYTIETASGQPITGEYNTPIAAGETATIEVPTPVTFGNGTETAIVSVGTVNGIRDDNQCNDNTNIQFIGFNPAPGKKVWVEEATGTWCQFCPRGDVYMNYLTKKYPELFVGVAVHSDDPMEFYEWDGRGDDPNTPEDEGVYLGALIPGFPSAVLDRTLVVDPSQLEAPFVESVIEAPLATQEHAASFDDETRMLTVDVKTLFSLVPLTNGTRIIVGLSEDGVTGDGDGTNADFQDYDQVNAFSGGAPIGGYENLPNPVPATQMVYNHVARVLMTEFEGLEDAYAGTTGNDETHTFNIAIPDSWDLKNMHIVSAFVNSDGTVHNSESSSLRTLLGLGTSTVDPVLTAAISVYPNPTSGIANIDIDFNAPQDVRMVVADAMGKVISKENLGTVSGQQTFQYDGSDLTAGLYYLQFISGNEITIKRLMIAE